VIENVIFSCRGVMKHIITLIDGTSRVARGEDGRRFSNIYRLNLALREKARASIKGRYNDQVVFYYPGIGSAKRLDRILATATAYGIEDIIKDAYVNIASNYYNHDKIYLFGFSRGAVAARLLADFISKFGLLRSDSIDLLDYAWAYYVAGSEFSLKNKFEEFVLSKNYEIRLPDYRRDNVKISFLGVFDAVPGFSNPEKSVLRHFNAGTLEPAPNIEVAIHILAIDERRTIFNPLVWQQNANKITNSGHQFIEQIWLPGVHTDIGGGYKHNLIANISLLTMIDKIRQYDITLKFYEDYITAIVDEVLNRHKNFVINKESIIPSVFADLLYRKGRIIKRVSIKKQKDYKKDAKGIYNSIHPLYYKMKGNHIRFRNKFKKYNNFYIDRIPAKDVLVTDFYDHDLMNSII
jgi:uncharacterized protein (DUF2235 family)